MENDFDKKLAGKTWYHQRFDGSPLFLTIIGESETREDSRRIKETEAHWRLCFFNEGKADWYLDQEDIKRAADIICKLAQTNPQLSKELMVLWKTDEDSFEAYVHKFDSLEFTDLDDEKLCDEFEIFIELAERRFTSSPMIDHFALGTDHAIAELLKQELGDRVEPSEFTSVFSLVTAPVHLSFVNEAELSLLRIANDIQQGDGLHSSQIQQELALHQKKFFWVRNNYVNSIILSLRDFEEEIGVWLDTKKDISHEIEKIQSTPIKNKLAKEAFFASTQLSPYLITLLTISEDFTKWQDERKRATFLVTALGMKFLEEIAKRRQMDSELLKYLTPMEVRKFFLENAITKEVLESRKQQCFILWGQGTETVLLGDDVSAMRTVIETDASSREIKDIRGLVASTGRAVGRVKVLMSANEVGKLEQGDILIAVMTRPDYVPAMKKAAAIVTDEGGITSHAAIVSREFGIPCIIGTKIATKVFKDGDLVEVNANHNWIKKLE